MSAVISKGRTRLELIKRFVRDDGGAGRRRRRAGLVRSANSSALVKPRRVVVGAAESSPLVPVYRPTNRRVRCRQRRGRRGQIASIKSGVAERATAGRRRQRWGGRACAVTAPLGEAVGQGVVGEGGGGWGDGEGLAFSTPKMLGGEGRVRGSEREAVLALPEPDQHGVRGDGERHG